MSKTCQTCKNNLNYFACQSVNHVHGGGTRPRHPAVPVPGGGQDGHSHTLPSVIPGSQVTTNVKTCMSKPAADQNIAHVYLNRICVNGTLIGRNRCCTQIVKLVAPNGAIVEIHVLWDRGAEHSVCSLDLVDFFWDSIPLYFKVNEVSAGKNVEGKLATLCLLGNDGKRFNIQALATNLNTSRVESESFPVPSSWQNLYSLPADYVTSSGAYTLIIGQDLNNIFPVEIDRFNKLSLFKSCINSELIVAGSVSNNDCNDCHVMTPASVPVMTPTVRCHPQRISAADTAWLDRMCPPDFAILPKVCQDCVQHKCNKCKSKLMLSPQQRFEDETLTKCISFVEEKKDNGALGHFMITGSYNSELKNVPTLYEECLRFQLKLEKRLLTMPMILDEFNKQIFKRIHNGNFSFLEDALKDNPTFGTYQKCFSPVNFSIKSTSINTPVRPCVNQGFAPNPSKPCLNSTMYCGPSLNLPIQQITLKIRSYLHWGISDISNFFQSVYLSPRDKALNLMLFRENGWGKPGRVKEIFSNKLNYGSRHSMFLANKCKILAGEKYILPVSEKAHNLLLSSLSDDVYCGSFNREEMYHLSQVLTDGLMKCNFILRDWVYSGMNEKEQQVSMGIPNFDRDSCTSTLGLVWFNRGDYWMIKPNICLAPRKRGAQDENFVITDMEKARELFEKYGVSRRGTLRLTHGFYDVINIFPQIKNNKHLLYRKLIRLYPEMGWDDLIPVSLHHEWLRVIEMTLECSQIKIPRFCMTDCIEMKGQLGLFCDGGIDSSCCRIFIRYKNIHGEYSSTYLTGATKLAPPGAACAPKTECESFLLSLRLAQTIKETFTDVEITDYFLFSDSTVTLGGVTGQTCTQRLFYSLRNFESSKIISELNVQLFLVETKNQEADIGSKLDLTTNHALSPTYFTGKWFFKPQKDWPVTPYEHRPSDIDFIQNPKMTLNVFSLTFSLSILTPLMAKYHSFDKIVNVLAYIFCFLKNVETFSSGWGRALIFILNMLKISKSELSGVGRKFLVQKDKNNLYVALPRNFMMKGQIIRQQLWIISSNEKVSEKIIFDCHQHCSNIGAELSRMYSKGFMVLKATKLFRKLSQCCLTCRRIRRACSPQLMGANHQLATQHLANFAVCYMDVMGWFKMRVSRNVTSKIWFLVLSDLRSRFTKFIPLQSMHCESVLMAIKTASYQLSGSLPYLIYSDSASNFIPISGLEGNDYDPEEQKKLVVDLKKALHSQKITLKTNCARASWRNSCAESLVRCYKLCLKKCGLEHKTFSLPQWSFIAAKIEYLCNNRCLSIKYLDQTLTPLRPCDLVFGLRKNIFPRDFDLNERDTRLFSNLMTLDKQIQAFENIYFATYCVELKKWTKFKTKGKQLDKGHICWMLDRINKSTKMPTLCEIVDKHSDRTFSVEYTSSEAKINPDTYEIIKVGKKKCVQRPSQMLCYITTKDCEDEVPTDPFVPLEDVDDNDILMSYKPPKEDLIDEILPENDEESSDNDDTPNTKTPGLLNDSNDTNTNDMVDDKVDSTENENDSTKDIDDDLNGSIVAKDDLIPDDVKDTATDIMDEPKDLIGPRDPTADSLTPGKSPLKVQYDSETPEMVDNVKLVKPTPRRGRRRRK